MPNIPKKPVVISASRMTDMPCFYPQEIINETQKRIEKGLSIHTLVLWTKHPHALLLNPLYNYLVGLRNKNVQLYIQLTINGLGGRALGEKINGKPFIPEPNVPAYSDSISSLPQIYELTQNPLRIRLRIDPVIRILDAKARIFSNINSFEEILKQAAAIGIKDFSFSFLEKGMHKKVDTRFLNIGCSINAPDSLERENMSRWVCALEKKYGVNIYSCCVPGLKESKCIDAELLQKLHNEQLEADYSQPRSRKLCGCTKSIDIGGWPPKKCNSGCDYCYARPVYAGE